MHLNTTTCKCGYEFTKQDIKPPLMGQAAAIGKKQKNFYGGNVDKFCEVLCPGPECGLKYALWLKQVGQTWKVVTISASGWDPSEINDEVVESDEGKDVFDDMDKDSLKAWLDERSIKYHPQTGEKKLRDACRAALIELAEKENEQ